jgi:hypothetical protein
VTTLQCLNLGVRFRAASPPVVDEFKCLYRSCVTPDAKARSVLELGVEPHGDRYLLTSYLNAQEGLVGASDEIDRAAVMSSSQSYVLLHGAVVAFEDRAALIVGPSGAGKSTLAAALTLAGFAYMADEIVGVRVGTTTCVAYPKPLKLDGRARRLLAAPFEDDQPACETPGEVLVAPDKFGVVSPTGIVATLAVVVMPLVVERQTAIVRALSRPDVGELLADQCFNFARWGAGALSTVATIARQCSGLQIQFGDLERATVAIDRLLR